MTTILRISIILDISNQQYQFKVYENVYASNLCNIIRRKYDFGNYVLQDICGTKSIFVLILCTCNLYLWHVVRLKHFIMNNSSFY